METTHLLARHEHTFQRFQALRHSDRCHGAPSSAPMRTTAHFASYLPGFGQFPAGWLALLPCSLDCEPLCNDGNACGTVDLLSIESTAKY
jgi:hypothetical protein